MNGLVQIIEDKLIEEKKNPSFKVGDTITVYYKISEGEKTRVQFFKGIVIQKGGTGKKATFTVRKISGDVGVERIFPLNMPDLERIELNKKGKVKQSKIGYFRQLSGKKATIKEDRTRAED